MNILKTIDNLVEQHKAVRRLLVLWAAIMITYVTHEIVLVMRYMKEVTGPVTTFYLGVTALLTAVIAFYQWSRDKDSK